MPVVFRTPIRTDFVEKYPMAKPVDLHDAHVIEYGIESQWKAYKTTVTIKGDGEYTFASKEDALHFITTLGYSPA